MGSFLDHGLLLGTATPPDFQAPRLPGHGIRPAAEPEYFLLDVQLVVYDNVMEAAEQGVKGAEGGSSIVRGGPGTGKSAIAMNPLGDLSEQGINAHYVTGSALTVVEPDALAEEAQIRRRAAPPRQRCSRRAPCRATRFVYDMTAPVIVV